MGAISIVGHTDPMGSLEFNQRLGTELIARFEPNRAADPIA